MDLSNYFSQEDLSLLYESLGLSEEELEEMKEDFEAQGRKPADLKKMMRGEA